MIHSIFRFLIQLAIVFFVLLSLNYYLLEELMKIEFSQLYYLIYLYFVLMVAGIHAMMLRSLKKRPQSFILAFMSSMGIKIFVSLGVLVVIMYTGINNTKPFAINYLILYLAFSAFSIYQMLKAQKEISPKEKK